MDTPDAPQDDLDRPQPPHRPTPAGSEAERFRRLVSDVWPPGEDAEARAEPDLRRHARPFMEHAVFDFGRRREEEGAPPPAKSAPCPLCGEPNRLRHAYCSRCGFRLPWAAQVEGLPEVEPRPDRIDQVLKRAVPGQGARCRFCNAPIQPYDRRCGQCKRWLISGWGDAEIDPWQPDFDRWNLSQVRGPKPRGYLSDIRFVLAIILWCALI